MKCGLCGKSDEFIGQAEDLDGLIDVINCNPVRFSRLFATELEAIGITPLNKDGLLVCAE